MSPPRICQPRTNRTNPHHASQPPAKKPVMICIASELHKKNRLTLNPAFKISIYRYRSPLASLVRRVFSNRFQTTQSKRLIPNQARSASTLHTNKRENHQLRNDYQSNLKRGIEIRSVSRSCVGNENRNHEIIRRK